VAQSGWLALSRHLAVLSLGASMLLGCAGEPAPPPPETAAVPPPQPAVPKAPPHVARRPAHKPFPPSATGGAEPEGASAEADNEALAMIAPEAAGPNPRPAGAAPPQLKELIGLDQPAATRMLGAAVERTEEPPATIWRYKTPTCELDLFFYLDLRSGQMRTLHYSFKGAATDAIARQNCLSELVAAHRS